MKIDIKTIVNYIVIFTIFSGGLAIKNFLLFADFRLIYFLMPLVFLLWLPFFKNNHFDRSFLWFCSVFVLIIIFSLINVFLGNNNILLLSKQIAGISLTSLIFFILFKINKYDVKKLFKIYLNLAFIVSLIGIIQGLNFLLDFEMGYDFSYLFPNWGLALSQTGLLRINSILAEPAGFCYVIMPAFFVSVVAIIKKKYSLLKRWKSLVVIIAFLLTFSTVGYIGIALSSVLLIFNFGKIRYLLLISLLLTVFLFFLWFNVEDFKMRIGDSFDVLVGKKSLEDSNLSTFALFGNALVTYRTFLDNPIFGHGLGSRPLSYDRYIGEVVDIKKVSTILNREGGNSLFLRILSETGLFGLILFLYFLFRHTVFKRKDKTSYLWIISNAVLIMFLIRLIRAEHYFNGGFFFFLWLYYFTWKINK
ncbi:MAG: O-antigen ligase family protein [Candidatus Helarchaeota archaeon]